MSSPSMEPIEAADVRLLARIWDWSDQVVEPVDAAGIARTAAAQAHASRRSSSRAWGTGLSLRMVLGLALLLIAGLVIALAAATLLRSSNPTDAYRAVVTRQVDGGVDVVLANADGSERILRHVTVAGLGLDPRYVIQTGGSVNEHGWLDLSVYGDGADRTGLARYGLEVLVDLADPTRAPIVFPGNGFMGARWGPDGRYALFCGGACDRSPDLYPQATEKPGFPRVSTVLDQGQVRVLDLDRGVTSQVIVPKVQTFGGGPDIVWAADGSGFLAHDAQGWGVTPIDGGPVVHGLPKVVSREQYATVPDLDQQYATELGLDDLAQYEDWGGHATVPDTTTSVGAQRSADWTAVWQLLVDTHQTSPRAVLIRRVPPDAIDSVHTFDVPEELGWAIQAVAGQDGSFVLPSFTLAPDDTFVALHGANENVDRFVLAPLTPGDQNVTTGPVIEGSLAGLVPAAEADAWPGQ